MKVLSINWDENELTIVGSEAQIDRWMEATKRDDCADFDERLGPCKCLVGGINEQIDLDVVCNRMAQVEDPSPYMTVRQLMAKLINMPPSAKVTVQTISGSGEDDGYFGSVIDCQQDENGIFLTVESESDPLPKKE